MTSRLQASTTLARSVLAGRLLLLGNAEDALDTHLHVDASRGGLVVVGAAARGAVRWLRQAQPNLVLLEQPSAHTAGVASVREPFILAADDAKDGQQVLFSPEQSVETDLDAQRRNGASLAILPTGYVQGGDRAALTAVLQAANLIDRDDVILHLPLHYTWAREPDVGKVIAAVNRSRHPVAVSLGHRGDPGSQKGVVEGLRRLVREAPAVSLWFTDLAGMDALAHGATACALGLSASHRHIVGPDQTGFSPNPADRSPNVLFPELLRYVKSGHMTERWFASRPAPECAKSCCGGQPIDRFDESRAHRRAAHRHNSLHLVDMHGAMMEAPSREAWWVDRLREAELAHTRLSLYTGVAGLTPQGALKEWIRMNAGYEVSA